MNTKLGDHLKIHQNINNEAINHFNLDHYKQEVIPKQEFRDDPPIIDLTKTNQPIPTDEGMNYPSGSGMASSTDEDLPQMPSSDEDEV